jgi:hypothetical protein
MNPQYCKQPAIFVALALLMTATRYHHFGSPVHLPDASLAVFFLAGSFVSAVWALPLLLLEAGAIDFFAISVGGVSGWCVTPAYGFLIPAYAGLWIGGRWYRARHRTAGAALLPLTAALLTTTSTAFVISNTGFFLFSGYFSQMIWADYAVAVAPYFPRYVTGTFGYVAVITLTYVLVTIARPLIATRRGQFPG